MLHYNVTSIMLYINIDVFMKVYLYYISLVTTMVVTPTCSTFDSILLNLVLIFYLFWIESKVICQ